MCAILTCTRWICEHAVLVDTLCYIYICSYIYIYIYSYIHIYMERSIFPSSVSAHRVSVSPQGFRVRALVPHAPTHAYRYPCTHTHVYIHTHTHHQEITLVNICRLILNDIWTHNFFYTTYKHTNFFNTTYKQIFFFKWHINTKIKLSHIHLFFQMTICVL